MSAITRMEIYLQTLAGNYKDEIPEPISREECCLYYLCTNYGLGNITQEQINEAVQNYLENNDTVIDVSGGTFADWGDE